MNVFDRYMLKNLTTAMVFVAVTLSVIIVLTQSLKFLELVIESGASSRLFWLLTLLALPRFFEIILPLALMTAVLFVYNRMISDSELIVMRASGLSPMVLARPAIVLSLIVTLFLMVMTMWAAPKSLAMMQNMRQEIKAQFSHILFRQGVFNQFGSGLTVYIRDKSSSGELLGIMIDDRRDKTKNPSSIIAKRGVLVSTDEGQEVVVFEGARHEFNPENGVLNRLNFDRYTINLPDAKPVRERWQEADERTIFELLNPDLGSVEDVQNLRNFMLEVHKRILSPFLAVLFTLFSCTVMLLGPFDRRGQGKRILVAVLCVTVMQGLYMSVFNFAKSSDVFQLLAYLLVVIPSGLCIFMLSAAGEEFRRQILYKEASEVQSS